MIHHFRIYGRFDKTNESGGKVKISKIFAPCDKNSRNAKVSQEE